MQKTMQIVLIMLITFNLFASIPTEQGLLRNLNNNPLPGGTVILKAIIKKSVDSLKSETSRVDYYKFIINTEGDISLLQLNYSGSQMLNSQLQDVKYIPHLIEAIKKDKTPEKGLFYGVLSMLSTNKSEGMEAFISKAGTIVTPNKNLLNEEKLRLLKTYRGYLVSTKGKGEASSPLNVQDPAEKARVIELFKSNTYKRSQNVSLIKEGNEFLWKADWKNVLAYFTNEERRLKYIEMFQGELSARLDASEYTFFNNNNEFPKMITVRDTNGEQYKIQILSEEVKRVEDKSLNEQLEAMKKVMVKPIEQSELFNFLF